MSDAIPLMPRLKAAGIGLIIGLLVGGAGAGKVWMDGNAALADANTATATAQEAATAAKTESEAKAAALEAKLGLAQARIAVAKAAMALEGMNYGTANEQLDSARALLKKHDGSEDAQRALMSLTVKPGDDQAATLARIHGAARVLDQP